MSEFSAYPSLVNIYSNVSSLDKPVTKFEVVLFSEIAFKRNRSPAIIKELIMSTEEIEKIAEKVKYFDMDTLGRREWAEIYSAIGFKFITLDENNNFNLNKTMTRAEAVKYLSLIPR